MPNELFEILRSKIEHSEKEFNDYRELLINEVISNGCNPHKLERLQWRINGVIRKKSSQMGTVIKLNSMMFDSFLDFQDSLNSFCGKKGR